MSNRADRGFGRVFLVVPQAVSDMDTVIHPESEQQGHDHDEEHAEAYVQPAQGSKGESGTCENWHKSHQHPARISKAYEEGYEDDAKDPAEDWDSPAFGAAE